MKDPATLPRLFVSSDRREAEPWVARWENVRKLSAPVNWARTGTWRGRPMIALANGVGAQRALAGIHTVRTVTEHPSEIWSIGTGGALDPDLAIAEVVVANSVTNGHRVWQALDPLGPPARSGTVHSVSRIVRTCEEKKNLHETGAILVEMEAAGVASMAYELAIPFYCVRVVSDLAEESFFIDFEEFLLPDGQFNVAGLLRFAMEHPLKGLPELLRLQERTAKAAKHLAEFLAECIL